MGKLSGLEQVLACLELVPAAKLGKPAFGGLEILGPAHLNSCGPDFFLAVDLSFLYFVVEDTLHVMVSWSAATLLAFAAIFSPPQQVPARNSILAGNLLHIMSI